MREPKPLRNATVKTNVGIPDRSLRIAAGVALIGFAVVGWIGPWGYIGIVPLLTGLLRMCPVYALFGISSCPHASR